MRALRNLIPWLAIIAILLGFHFWGVHQRKREWWWLSGDRSGMLFLDLANASEGHVLSTDGNKAEEFYIEWNCSNHQVRWGEMWTRDRNFNQLERSPAPRDLATWHPAASSGERRVLEVACAQTNDRLALRSVKTERPPIDATRDAIEAVKRGVPPKDALLNALGGKFPKGPER